MRHSRSLLLIAAAALVAVGGAESRTALGPTPTAPPTVIGTFAAGKRVTALSGTWAGSGSIAYRFQWSRCNAAGAACLSIHGATSPTYALVDRDVGRTLGLTVTATDTTGTARAYANLIGPIAPSRPLLVATAQPTISGPPVEGKSLQVSTGTWSPTPTKVTYTWERCNANARVCAAIQDATGAAYTVSKADLGHALAVLVQATFGTTSQNAFSTATPAAVGAHVSGPTPLALPGIMGTALEGQKLSAASGIWRGVGAIGYGFQWYRCDTTGNACSSIQGSTSPTYTLVAKDVGETIGLTVRATDATGSVAAYSSLIGPIADGAALLSATAQPSISGTPRTGQALTVSNGGWTVTPRRYAYRWLRCNANGRLCAAIPAAAGASYTVTPDDAGHALVGVVEARAAGHAQSALSISTAAAT